jgi:DUF1365 family protein
VFTFALDLDELDQVVDRLRLVRRNRRGIVAFHDDDYLVSGRGPLREQVDGILRSAGVDPVGVQVTLVANLRILGYVFNPASFYLCRDAAGELVAVLIDVHNTFGERHLYPLLPERSGTEPAGGARFSASMDKAFYVSPFIGMEARYRVQVIDEADRLRISILETEAGEHLLTATMDLRRRPLSDRSLARMLLRYPLVPQMTIAAIHVHAFRLWRRGIPVHAHRAAREGAT